MLVKRIDLSVSFEDDTNLSGSVDVLESRKALQGICTSWIKVNTNCIAFITAKCHILDLSNKSVQCYRFGTEHLESSP